MAERLRLGALLNRDTYERFYDFDHFVTAQDGLTSLAADGNSSVTVDADGTHGVLIINTGDATNNQEAAVFTTNEVILPQPGKPWECETSLQFTEINTSAANVAFGLADVMGGANTLVDDGAGPATSFYGALIYKVDGETVWRCASSAGALSSTGTTTETAHTAGGTAYQRLRIKGLPVEGNVSEVTFYLDGVQMTDTNGKPIKHRMTHGAAATADGNVGVYGKAGAANTVVINVDYLWLGQKR